MPTVVFSWQIDTPTTSGRNLIERAMEDAIKALRSNASVEEALRDDELTIDKDMQGVADSPPIMDTIFAKIDTARACLADLTFVGQRQDGRRMPNSNVTLEYGWALKSLGHQYIIGVMNVAYGDPTEFPLPFDLGHLRHPIKFNCPSDADEATRKEQRRQLAVRFRDSLKAVLAIEAPSDAAMPAAYVPLEPMDGRARFRPRAHAIGVLQTRKSPFGSTEFESPKWTTIDDGPAMWLRVLPTRPLDRPFTIGAVAAAIRLDELVKAGRGDLHHEVVPELNDEQAWVLSVVGKGDKEREVPLQTDVVVLLDQHWDAICGAGRGRRGSFDDAVAANAGPIGGAVEPRRRWPDHQGTPDKRRRRTAVCRRHLCDPEALLRSSRGERARRPRRRQVQTRERALDAAHVRAPGVRPRRPSRSGF